MRLIFLLYFLGISVLGFTQQRTVGVTQYTDRVSEGLVFFCPSTTDCYLVDECGKLVNEWDRVYRPGLAARLLNNGLMLRTFKVPDPELNQASEGGGIELIDGDNNAIGIYIVNDDNIIQHHDAIMMPNGNILLLAWERLTSAELDGYGAIASNLWSEIVYEIELVDESNYNIVWEWNLRNQFIQEIDPSLDNYAIISENIGKVNVNYKGPTAFGGAESWHCNAIDYNEELDQILVNSRSNSEAWIIDHSTTTAEAATDTGGNSGKGGQLLYRWGNPASYNRGTLADMKMFGSHGLHWIEQGLPNAGKLLFFNNGDERPGFNLYSTVEMIQPVMEDDVYLTNNNAIYFPLESELVYRAENPEDFYSTYLSNAQQLENGNVFINEGGDSRFFEVDPSDNSIVWEYISPVYFSGFLPEDANPSNSRTFRAYKYPRDFSGFEGWDLSSGDVLELGGELELECATFVSVEDQDLDRFAQMWSVFPNPVSSENKIIIETTEEESYVKASLQIVDAHGQKIRSYDIENGTKEIDIDAWSPGVYYCIIRSRDDVATLKFFKM